MKQARCELSGITWCHSRALPPLVAAAQRFEELNPHVRIRWEKRSLDEFGHMDVAELADRFDLVVVDHPWAGYAVERGLFLDLRRHVEEARLGALRISTIGASFDSYVFDGQLLALPIDAASPAASYRSDLLADADVPRTWNDVVSLARRGRVIMSGFHVDLLLHLVMLTATVSDTPLFEGDVWADDVVLEEAMERLTELAHHVSSECFDWNPIDVYEAMTAREDAAPYCAFAYTYSNYSRDGYARRRLRFTDLASIPGRGDLRGVLGGTGLALSRRCAGSSDALCYALYVASGDVQRTLYTTAGGQPAHGAAWDDETANGLTDGFFRRTRSSIERAYLRPRYDGYVHFQANAGRPLAAWVRGEISRRGSVDQMNAIYRESRRASARACA